MQNANAIQTLTKSKVLFLEALRTIYIFQSLDLYAHPYMNA